MTFLLFPLFPVLTLGIIGVSVQTYYRITRRGYTPPTAGFVLVMCWAIGISGVVELASWKASGLNDTPLLFVLALLGLPALSMAIAPLALPRRPHRSVGVRRTRLPLVALSYLLFVLAAVVVALPLAIALSGSHIKVRRAGQLASLLVTTGWYLRYLDTLRKKPTVAQARKRDPRPPVLYLRPFNQERDYFAVAPPAFVSRTANPMMKRAVERDHAEAVPLTLEQYLGAEIERDLGPLVALGSPEDYLPPEGAARTYADDRDWQQQFEALASSATAIVMEVSDSENLRWEIEWLRAHDLHTKLIVVTRPVPVSNLEWITQLWYRWLPALRGLKRRRWTTFASQLAALGYTIDFEEAGPGAVIGFDTGGRALALMCGASEPAAFVSSARQWLTSRDPHAALTPGTCAACGRVSPLPVAKGSARAICASCAAALSVTGLSPREQWKRLWWGQLFWWWFFFVGPGAFIGILTYFPDRLRQVDSAIWIAVAAALVIALLPIWMPFCLSASPAKPRPVGRTAG